MKFSIDPGTYSVTGKGADKAQAAITANGMATPDLVDFNNPAVLVALFGIFITIFFVLKRVRGGIVLSIAATTIVAILVGVVDLSKINFASNNIGAAVQDLGKIFGISVGAKRHDDLFVRRKRLRRGEIGRAHV